MLLFRFIFVGDEIVCSHSVLTASSLFGEESKPLEY